MYKAPQSLEVECYVKGPFILKGKIMVKSRIKQVKIVVNGEIILESVPLNKFG